MRVHVYGRLSFPQLDKPSAFEAGGNLRYSATVLIDPEGESTKKVLKAMRQVAAEKWGEKNADRAVKSLRDKDRTCLTDGDDKPNLAGYPGNLALAAHSPANQPPTLVVTKDGRNISLDRESQGVIYAGCYVNAIVELWAQDNQWGKRINGTIKGLQFVKDGEPFSGGVPASEDDFELIEAEDVDFTGATTEEEADDIPF